MSIGAVPAVQQDGAGVNASAASAAGIANTGAMNYGYSANGAVTSPNTTANVIPTVSDPQQVMADITRQQYLDYINNYGQFEEDLINKAQNDTSLIDQAREDVSLTQGIAQGIADRNASRYGTYVTPAMREQQQRTLQRQNTLGGINQINNAKLAQRQANMGLLGDLINIGQGINRSALDQMGSAAADAANRNAAYQNAKAASKAQTYSTIGSLGAMAIFAMAF